MGVYWKRTVLMDKPLESVWISLPRESRIMSYHQLWKHAIQLIISWHRQWWLHGLQGKVLPKSVGDLWVIVAVKTAEDEGEATAATATTFPRSHDCQMCSAGQVGRFGGSFGASLQPPPPQSLASVREYCGHSEGTRCVFNIDTNQFLHRRELWFEQTKYKHQHFLFSYLTLIDCTTMSHGRVMKWKPSFSRISVFRPFHLPFLPIQLWLFSKDLMRHD